MNSVRKENQEKKLFAPGCALMIYKPESAEKLHFILRENLGETEMLLTCCKHDPLTGIMTRVINVCPGCDKRLGSDYENISSISLWEILAESDFFKFPDYKGKAMSILDACPTRDQERVQSSIRKVLNKMNITLVEPKNTKSNSTCCGDSFYGLIPNRKLKDLMKKRTAEMPVDDVVVYCISCIKSIHIGGKKPRYLIDLLFNEKTVPKTFEPDEWHLQLNNYIQNH
jgi:Fe-S oxidoreductase